MSVSKSTMDSQAMICAQDLTKQYNDLTAVDHLSLSIYPGEIFGLVGPDGAGKTTCLRMLAGILEPTRGTGMIAGNDIITHSENVKEHLAYMSQRFGLYPDLTVWENINFYADLYGVPRKNRSQHIDELLDFSQMRPFKKRRADNLSGGMKQKLQLVCALVHTPQVLLLDEPTNGVDPVSRRDFWRILHRLLQQNVSILLTTAYLDEAERCNRVGLLNNGHLMIMGTPLELKKELDGKLLTVASTHARDLHKKLKSTLDCDGITLFGDTIHIMCQDRQKTKNKVTHLLNASGLPHESVQEAVPTLEDVFVHMLTPDHTHTDHPTGALKPEPETIQMPHHQIDEELAVEARNLTRRFGGFIAVNNISFSVPKGEIFGFLGPNGAGKSTTIRMLCGLLRPSQGAGRVAGFDVHTQAENIKQHIGYMSQKFSLYSDLTVEENIDFYGGIYGLGGHRLMDRKKWALEMAGLTNRQHTLTAVLSGGWKQRLALACAILHEPPVIFLDEPTSGVDPISRRRFWDLIYEMADHGVTIFVTTHYMEEAEYCDRLAMIYGGRMIALGTPRELKTNSIDAGFNPTMEDVFVSLIEAVNQKEDVVASQFGDDHD